MNNISDLHKQGAYHAHHVVIPWYYLTEITTDGSIFVQLESQKMRHCGAITCRFIIYIFLVYPDIILQTPIFQEIYSKEIQFYNLNFNKSELGIIASSWGPHNTFSKHKDGTKGIKQGPDILKLKIFTTLLYMKVCQSWTNLP